MAYSHNAGMHPLEKYLLHKAETQIAFAKRVRCKQSTLSKIINGDRDAGMGLAAKIYKATDGEVSLFRIPSLRKINPKRAQRLNEHLVNVN